MTFYKYTKIKALGDRDNEGILTIPGKVIIEEKIDGANFAFFVEENVLYFCSHNQNLTDSNQIEETGIPKNWRAIEPVLNSWKEDPTRFDTNLYYYAESMQKHTLKYNNIFGCIGFDILNLKTGRLIDWELAQCYFKDLGLPFVHVIEKLEATEINPDQLKSLYQKSAYKEGKAEGIVIKRYDIKNRNNDPMFAKIVDDGFKEQNHKVFGTPQSKKTDDDKVAEIYATPGRIEKIIHKMVDEGHEIEMPMMKNLFKRVVEDILEEEIITIYYRHYDINFKNLNKIVSKKCAIVLKELMIKNAS